MVKYIKATVDSRTALENKLKSFETDDYQNRNGDYPKSDIPDSISYYKFGLEFYFKNTSEKSAKNWVKTFCDKNGLVPTSIDAWQDGDYQDDWVVCEADFVASNQGKLDNDMVAESDSEEAVPTETLEDQIKNIWYTYYTGEFGSIEALGKELSKIGVSLADCKTAYIGPNARGDGWDVLGFWSDDNIEYKLSGIEQFVVDKSNPKYIAIDGVLFSKDKKVLWVYPPKKSGETYSIPNGTQVIGCNAFSDSQLRTINIPNSVTHLYEWAFNNCPKLQSLELPDSITGYLNDRTISSCDELKFVRLSKNLDEIGFNGSLAFNPKLKFVSIPGKNTTIENVGWGDEHVFEDSPNVTVYTQSESAIEYCKEFGIDCIERILV